MSRRIRPDAPRLKDRWVGWSWLLKESLLPTWRSENAPILVGGCGRSGTTLVQVMLDAHPDLCCVRESSILQPGKLDTAKLAARIGLPVDRLRALADSSARHGEFVERVFEEYCQVVGKPRWADKSPRNVRRLKTIYKHFPRARFVHLIRDGRDTACSLRTHPRFRRLEGPDSPLVELDTWKPMEDCARRWVEDVSAGLAWRGHPGYTELRYEDLATDPEGSLRRIFDFLGVRWAPEVLDYHTKGERSGKDPGFEKPVFTSSIGRWRKHMSSEDVRTFKRIAGPLLMELGYADDLDWDSDGTAVHRDGRRGMFPKETSREASGASNA